jgi:sugar transferase (PEP-CTERM/EpsH1 system associated)
MSDIDITKKEPLLFLCHRIPFPPNKGDKIRSFNILKKLAERFDVHLGCFIDDPFDKQYVNKLRKYCQSVFHLDQNKTIAKIKGLTSFITAKPITLPYYFDKKMQQWTDGILQTEKMTKVFIYSSSMAQYCDGAKYVHLERVIDFVDVDSDKWRQYADKKTGIAQWVFQRESQLLAKYETKICRDFNHSLFVSSDEAKLFCQLQPSIEPNKVHGLLNGVDVDFFDPYVGFSVEKLVPNQAFISFTGAMDYWANIDAVIWFTKHVWPSILKQQPQAVFCIVGGNPSSEIKALAKLTGIVVTGRVVDVRPFIAKAQCIVAPMQIARGIQNKVLEAMSLNKPIVVSSMAMEGINAMQSADIIIADEASDVVTHCLSFFEKNNENQESLNRKWILAHFTWQQTLLPLKQYFSDQKG